MMVKLVLIINGKGGVGKDTLCDFAGKYFIVRNISSITPIKQIALQNGWDGTKDAKSRKLLADLKKAFTEYNNLPCSYLCKEYETFLDSEEQIMFVHIREGEEIDKFRQKVKLPCAAILITREQMQNISWGNDSDDKVDCYHYDYEYCNNKPLEEAGEDFVRFIENIYRDLEEDK